MSELWKTKPRLKTYFPSQDQADMENMTLKEFYELYSNACSIDWERIKEWNEELAELFREYDEVEIKWEHVDISFDIKWMWARNSVIETNYPWSEVFTAPNKFWVNWWIIYNNPVFFKYTWDIVEGLKFTFSEWKLIDLDIVSSKYSNTEKKDIIDRMNDIFDEDEWNRYLWELAFWTNFFVPAWIKHRLIWEKAIWMHIALWKSYKYPEVNNWNDKDWLIHWDAIRNMEDWSIVSFKKNSWEKIEIMNNWNFNSKTLPKISNYQEEINKNTR